MNIADDKTPCFTSDEKEEVKKAWMLLNASGVLSTSLEDIDDVRKFAYWADLENVNFNWDGIHKLWNQWISLSDTKLLGKMKAD